MARLIRNVEPADVGHSCPNSQSLSTVTSNAMPAATKDQTVLRRAMACASRSTFSWRTTRRSIFSLMARRWAGAALLAVEKRLHRIKGYPDLGQLPTALGRSPEATELALGEGVA